MEGIACISIQARRATPGAEAAGRCACCAESFEKPVTSFAVSGVSRRELLDYLEDCGGMICWLDDAPAVVNNRPEAKDARRLAEQSLKIARELMRRPE